ncbi:hypothetical protein [Psychrobacillus sp. FSL H8-0487]|uniref:hypothetical protein n=1 Tax=Psychrobacillus sp. FSL H8-0487 TaxID=2921391 RepID=UPI0030F77D1E
MKFMKMKKFFIVCFATLGIIVIVFIVNIGSDQLPITENNVRTQLEQMYDAEVAEVKKNEDVYEAIIAKSGQVYLVEMNATTGDVNSLEHTDEFTIKEVPIIKKEVTNGVVDKSPVVSPKSTKTQLTAEKGKSIGVSSKGSSNLVIAEKPKEETSKIKNVGSSKNNENKKEGTSKTVEEKPIKVIKDVLNKEVNKTETATKDNKKVENEKKEEKIAKAEASKIANESELLKEDSEQLEVLKIEPTKAEASKTAILEVPKSEESQSSTETISLKSEETSDNNATILITAEESIKLAIAYQKGIVESNKFIRTNEGGYYLVVMEVESSKEKKPKATLQIHAISGKVISITWQ